MTSTTTTSDSGSPSDRQRQRESRATRPGRGLGGDRLPAPPRQRRPVMAALAVVLIVGGAALAGLLALRVDERVPVLVAGRDIPVGTRLTAQDLAVARVASEGIASIDADKAKQVVGLYATEGIKGGQLVDASMVARTGFLKPGSVAVGVPMTPGRVPADGLRVGDVVQVLRVPKQGDTVELVNRATVSGTTIPETSSGGLTDTSSSVSSGNQAATLVVGAAQAPPVASAAATDEIVLVLVERGATTQADG